MLSLSDRRIFIAVQPTDMRRGIDMLASYVHSELHHDPKNGDVFVFLSSNRKRVKLLVWDLTGYWLLMKRLSSGAFAPPRRSALASDTRQPSQLLSAAELYQVLEGIDIHHATYRSHTRRASFAENST